ncbi:MULTISPECIES: hypothetical protein [unclassified Corallococcus]|uniref:hypothetical protein n=1 Tax=unclassified Corallococcus TaxID=2685029 RepID=UPI001A8FDD78|nr:MULTISPECIES: hypothetical protein [unclassified Corallococcus]MBN9681584.1 hypothetical protein [Corallococcus sp. NCSPR001]WAS86841.1 hypothetical protein O0N60_07665 [Corallococcus sp. NCRR]
MGPSDLEYTVTLEALPKDLQPFAKELPFHLGLTTHPEGGWNDYSALAPFQRLPAYASERQGPGLAPELQSRYLRAHHRGGFFGLLIDRLDDGQVPQRPEWPRLRQALFDQWLQSLTDATGNEVLATEAIKVALEDWAEAVSNEKALLSRRSLSMAQYACLVSQKVSWLGTSAFCLLLAHGDPARLPAFRRAFDLLLLSSQCLDDALDAEEDARLHGIGFPEALGHPPRGLLRTAPGVARLGATLAYKGGFNELGTWLAERARSLDESHSGKSSLQAEMSALALMAAVTQLYGGPTVTHP